MGRRVRLVSVAGSIAALPLATSLLIGRASVLVDAKGVQAVDVPGPNSSAPRIEPRTTEARAVMA